MELRWSLHLDRPADAVLLLSRKLHWTKDLIYSADAEIGAQSVNQKQVRNGSMHLCSCGFSVWFPSGPTEKREST